MKGICTDSKCSEMKTWNNGKIRAISKLENKFQTSIGYIIGEINQSLLNTIQHLQLYLSFSFLRFLFFFFFFLFHLFFTSLFFFTYHTLICLNCNRHHNKNIQSQVTFQIKVWKVICMVYNSNLELLGILGL